MARTCDILVIGAGVIGSAIAYRLAARGHDTVLIGDGAPGGTDAAAGMLCPSFELSHDAGGPRLAELLRKSGPAWDVFASELSDDPAGDFGYQRGGAYGIGYHARPPQAVRAEKDILPGFARAPSFFVPGEGSVEPLRLVSHLRTRFVKAGGLLVRARASLGSEEVAAGLDTFRPKTVVLATGAAKEAGPEALTQVAGEAFLVKLPEPELVSFVVRSPTAYFVPRSDGTLYIGATENWPGAIPQHSDELWREALRLLPALGEARLLRRFQGLRPFIGRDGPLVARDGERPNLIRAQGHHRNGVLFAPLTAETVEDLL